MGRKTHWEYVKGSGKPGLCQKCGERGFVHWVRNFDGSLTRRTTHHLPGRRGKTCWGERRPD